MNRFKIFGLLLPLLLLSAGSQAAPLQSTEVIPTGYGFTELTSRLRQAITDNKMGLVTQASASRGAASRGIKIPGNIVLGVYRNDFAVRMLKASVASGIEAPIRFYVTENPDGTATLSYRTPSTVFVPYKNDDLDQMARELDIIFTRIATQATRTGPQAPVRE